MVYRAVLTVITMRRDIKLAAPGSSRMDIGTVLAIPMMLKAGKLAKPGSSWTAAMAATYTLSMDRVAGNKSLPTAVTGHTRKMLKAITRNWITVSMVSNPATSGAKPMAAMATTPSKPMVPAAARPITPTVATVPTPRTAKAAAIPSITMPTATRSMKWLLPTRTQPPEARLPFLTADTTLLPITATAI